MSDKISAKLNSIRYQSDNGFIIGMFSDLKAEGVKKHLEFGALGNMLNPQPGMEYQLVGEWSNHPSYGKQFKFSNYSAIKPNDTNGIYKYLVRTAKWVGPTIAQQLVEIYGAETLDVLRESPEIVAAEIRGITEGRAKEIQQILIENEEEEAVLVELMKILNIPGLRKSLPYELIEKFGSNAAEILKKNPYVITQFHGSGFLIADRLAIQTLKIDPNSMFRIKAAIGYVMDRDLHSNGNTWIHIDRLISNVLELTSIQNVEQIGLGIDELLAIEAIVEIKDGWLSLWKTDQDETYIANTLKEML